MYTTLLGSGGARAPPPRNLAEQLTLFAAGWADFAPNTTTSPSGFRKLSTPLPIKMAYYVHRLSLTPFHLDMFLRACFQNVVYHIGVKKK